MRSGRARRSASARSATSSASTGTSASSRRRSPTTRTASCTSRWCGPPHTKNTPKRTHMERQLAGKPALVTGSSSGIGRAIAERYAREGANVVLNGFGDAKEIEALRSGLEKEHGVKATYDGADMTRPGEITDMVSSAVKAFGKVDILVNNAGIQH